MALDIRAHLKGLFSWREPGGALSLAAHVGLLVFGIATFSSAKPFQPAAEAVAVDVLSEKDFNEMMKGDKESKIIAKEPERRVERVAEEKKDNEPGLAKKDVVAPPQKAESKPEPKPEPEKVASVTPPPRPPELRVNPPAPKAPPAPAKAEEEDDEVDEKAELLRRKKAEDQKKLDDAKAAAEEKRKLDERLKAEADAQKRAEDKRKLDETLKAEAEAEKRAEEKRQADAKKKAEADRKAREDKAKKDREAKEAAEQENKLFASISNRLQTSKEAPSSTGSSGAVVSSRSTAGSTNATGKKLSPSDRAQLIGILTEQMSRCISYSGSAPKAFPRLVFSMTRDGGIAGNVQLTNSSPEPNFRPFAEAAMRALRNCQPYKIPARFLDSYDDWKTIDLNLVTTDMQ